MRLLRGNLGATFESILQALPEDDQGLVIEFRALIRSRKKRRQAGHHDRHRFASGALLRNEQ